MKCPSPLILAIVGLSKLSALGDQAGLSDHAGPLDNWPQWRGPLANGVATGVYRGRTFCAKSGRTRAVTKPAASLPIRPSRMANGSTPFSVLAAFIASI